MIVILNIVFVSIAISPQLFVNFPSYNRDFHKSAYFCKPSFVENTFATFQF